jgi:sigma-54 dependent transcriptional regulator, acetoin dehydrogenase operon transcriptional activator AcoR
MEPAREIDRPLVTDVAFRPEWEAFQAEGTVVDGVRPEIARSWRRCTDARLGAEVPAPPVDEAALRGFDHSGHNRRQFMAAGRELADHLIFELGDATAAVVVCDDFGVVQYLAGRPEVLRVTETVNLVPGGVWSERTAGTNGIGLALELGGSAHVFAGEHYLEALHGFSCTAAIVRHPVTREALGVLGMATDTNIPGSFAEPLIVRAALDVERLLEDQVFGRERELMEHYLRSRAGRAAPFLTVDRAGHTVIQNARMLQSATGEDVQLLLAVARQALAAETDVADQLELSRGSSHVEVRLVRGEGEVLGALVSVERIGRGRSQPDLAAASDWAPIVGRSPAMQRLFREAGRVARQRMTVAIQGEAGTGKLMLAEHLHTLGGSGPLSVVHCTRPRWEREWDDAVRSGGTVVLRRVHALSPEAQLTLCDRFDELAEAEADVWVISLINSESEPPGPELSSRLARVSLLVPALRDRSHDLRLLVDHWCELRERLTGTRPVVRPEAHDALAAQPWPGNVRELHNTLDAAALRGGTVIGVESLQLDPRARARTALDASNLREIEREAINTALERNGGNVSRAAKELGIGRATLHRRLRAYRLLAPAATNDSFSGDSES